MAKKNHGPSKIQRMKRLIRRRLAKTSERHAAAVEYSESLRWNSRVGMDAIRKAEALSGEKEVLEDLLLWCDEHNVPDFE